MVKSIFKFSLFILAVAGILSVSAGTGFSQQDQCRIVITKSTDPFSVDEEFEFISEVNGVETQFTVLSDDQETAAIINEGESVKVTELPRDGWVLVEADCFFLDGAEAFASANGVPVLCTEGGEFNGANCIFRNRQIPDVPTLSEWGMISAAAGLGLIGVFFAVRRRRKAQAV
jgi:hypothetical protein